MEPTATGSRKSSLVLNLASTPSGLTPTARLVAVEGPLLIVAVLQLLDGQHEILLAHLWDDERVLVEHHAL